MTPLRRIVESPVEKGNAGFNEYIALEHIEPGTGRLLSDAEIEKREDLQAVRYEADDVLFGKLRPYLHKVYQPDREGVCSAELLVLRAGASQIDPRFLFYTVLSKSFVDWATATSYGVKMPRTSWELVADYPIPELSLSVQRVVADFLDRETHLIDSLVEAKKKLIDLLAEKRTALITHAVTKGLDPSVQTKDSGIDGVGVIPSHWHVKPLQRLVEATRPITYGIVLPGPNVDDGVPIIKSGDVKPGRLALGRLDRTTREIEAKYERSRVFPGDLVYAIRGSVGAVERVPSTVPLANLTQDTARIAPHPNVDADWLLQALRSRAFYSQLESTMTGSAVKGFNIGRLNKARVPTPSLDEQVVIATRLTRQTAMIVTAADSVTRQLDLLAEYRQALITAAVTGQLDEATLRGEKPVGEAMEMELPA